MDEGPCGDGVPCVEAEEGRGGEEVGRELQDEEDRVDVGEDMNQEAEEEAERSFRAGPSCQGWVGRVSRPGPLPRPRTGKNLKGEKRDMSVRGGISLTFSTVVYYPKD